MEAKGTKNMLAILTMNESGLNFSTEHQSDMKGRSAAIMVIQSSLFALIVIAAFIGNLLICLVLYKNRALRTITNAFVLSLALTDLLMSLLVIPLKIASAFIASEIVSDLACQVTGILVYNLAGVSLLTLTHIAVNRYIRVVKPSLYPKIYTKRSAAIMVVSVWVITILIGLVAFSLLGVKFRHINPNPVICSIIYSNKTDIAFYTFVIVLYNVPTSLVIAVCYILLYRKIRQHNVTMRRPSVVCKASGMRGVEESVMTKMFAAVLVGFYLCWTPVFVTNVLNAFDEITSEAHVYSSFYHLLPAYTSSMINPIIYATMSPRFRAEFVKIICKNKSDVNHFSMTSKRGRELTPKDQFNLKICASDSYHVHIPE